MASEQPEVGAQILLGGSGLSSSTREEASASSVTAAGVASAAVVSKSRFKNLKAVIPGPFRSSSPKMVQGVAADASTPPLSPPAGGASEPNSADLLAGLQVPDRLKFDVGASDDEDAGSESGGSTSENKDDVESSESCVGGAGSSSKAQLFSEFEQWLLDCGAVFPDLYLKRYTGDVRGVHCKRRVSPYVCLLQVPLKCLITDHMGRTETELGRQLFASSAQLSTPNLVAVIIYILTTREDAEHFFQPYYRILPKDYSNFPIFWSEEQLAWLQGSPLVEDIAERKRNMRADYDECVRAVPAFRRFSLDEFLEVRTAVGSRNFGIVVHGNKRTAMVPYADMLNHYRPRETSWTFEDAKDAFTITSLSALQPGQQVMDSYGKKCNAKFLLHYGFAVESNREEDGKCQNEIYVRLALPPAAEDHAAHELRLAVLGPGRASRGFRLSMNIEDKATAEALGFCRVAVADEHELHAIAQLCGIDAAAGSAASADTSSARAAAYRDSYAERAVAFVSMRNEIAALDMLAQACNYQLRQYPDTFEGNVRLLDKGGLKPFSVRRTALIVVIGEQEICKFWIYACDTIAQMLHAADDDAPLHVALRALPRATPKEADLARYASRLAYELRMAKA